GCDGDPGRDASTGGTRARAVHAHDVRADARSAWHHSGHTGRAPLGWVPRASSGRREADTALPEDRGRRHLIVDSHCHVQDSRFDGDRDAILARAALAGVGAIVAPAVDADSARRALDLARQDRSISVAVGVHPNDRDLAADWSEIEELASESEVVAIGETGLDYMRGR